MPKVTEAHREARKQHIVAAAFRCFARKGFHPTTMQDICAEAEVSPGAVYGYFAGKEEIILSACDESQNATDVEMVHAALAVADTRVMLRDLAWAFFSRLDGPEAEVVNRVTLQLWAEAVVDERVLETYDKGAGQIGAALQAMVAEGQRRGDFNRDLDAGAVVTAMFALYNGYQLEKAIHPEIDTEAYVAVVESLLTGSFWTGAAG